MAYMFETKMVLFPIGLCSEYKGCKATMDGYSGVLSFIGSYKPFIVTESGKETELELFDIVTIGRTHIVLMETTETMEPNNEKVPDSLDLDPSTDVLPFDLDGDEDF